jgi:DNA anti-recombination protein RmuC
MHKLHKKEKSTVIKMQQDAIKKLHQEITDLVKILPGNIAESSKGRPGSKS